MCLYGNRAGSRICTERHITSSAGRSWRCTCLSCITALMLSFLILQLPTDGAMYLSHCTGV